MLSLRRLSGYQDKPNNKKQIELKESGMPLPEIISELMSIGLSRREAKGEIDASTKTESVTRNDDSGRETIMQELAKEHLEDGWTNKEVISDLITSGFSKKEIFSKLRTIGIPQEEVFSELQILDKEEDIVTDPTSDISVSQLVASGISSKEILSQMKGTGMTDREIISEFRALGVSLKEVVTQFKASGMTNKDIISELKTAGLNKNEIIAEMKNVDMPKEIVSGLKKDKQKEYSKQHVRNKEKDDARLFSSLLPKRGLRILFDKYAKEEDKRRFYQHKDETTKTARDDGHKLERNLKKRHKFDDPSKLKYQISSCVPRGIKGYIPDERVVCTEEDLFLDQLCVQNWTNVKGW